MAVMDIMLSFPSLILALALIAAAVRAGHPARAASARSSIVLTILVDPGPGPHHPGQHARVQPARVRHSRPARSAPATAASSCEEILPNVLPSMLSFAFIALAILVVAEGALAFLGLSVEAPTRRRGASSSSCGRGDLDKAPYLALIPCAFLFLTLLSLNLVGDKLQARFAVREATGLMARRDAGGSPRADPVRRRAGHLLVVDDLRTRFRTPRGAVRAVDGVSFTLERGRPSASSASRARARPCCPARSWACCPAATSRSPGTVLYEGRDITGAQRRRHARRSGAPRWRWSSRTR